MVAHEVLEDHPDVGAQVVQVVLAQVLPVEQDAALVRVVQPRQQFHQRGLAGAVLADQRQHLASAELEIQPAQRPALGAGVAEAHVLEAEAAGDRPRHRQRPGRRGDSRLDREEGEQVVQVQRLAGDLGEADQQPLQQLPQATEAAGQESQVADGEVAVHRAPGDVGVGHVVAQRAERGEQRPPHGPSAGEGAVGAEERLGQLAVTGDHVAMEVEDLHLLRGFHARAHLPHVLELAALRRPGEVERVAQGVEVRFADEGRDQRDRQQQDQPGRIDQQPDGEADDGDRVLDLPEQLAHQVRAAHGLAPGALELVLQLRVLEVGEVQRGRVLHQAHAGGVGEQLRQQRIAVADHPAEQVRQDCQAQLCQDQPGEVVEHAAAPGLQQAVETDAHADQPHHLVDDQLADVQRHHRHERAYKAQAEGEERQQRAGGPDLPEERRDVAQRVEAVAQTGTYISAGCGGVP